MDPLPKFANSMSVPCLCSFRVLVRVLVLVRVRVPVRVPVHARDQFLNGAMKIDIWHGNYLFDSQGPYEVARQIKGSLKLERTGKSA